MSWHRYEGEHDCWAAGCDAQLTVAGSTPAPPPTSAERLRNHACSVCGHDCTQLERDLASFMRSGEWHPDAVRGTSIDPQVPESLVREIEQTGAVVGVIGAEPEPHALASQLRELARLVDREGTLRDREKARRLGLAAARVMGPRWQHRRRMIEGDDEPAT